MIQLHFKISFLWTSLVTTKCVSFKLDGVYVTAWHAYHHKSVDHLIIPILSAMCISTETSCVYYE